MLSIVDCIREGRYEFSDKEISPTYFWGLPSIMRKFLETASFKTDYLYFVSTYGTTPGASDYMAKKAISGRRIDTFYFVRMPDTWTPLFDLSTPEKAATFSKTTEDEIDYIACKVGERLSNKKMPPRTPAFAAVLIAQPIYNNSIRRTSRLLVEDSCIGCGLCERKCPVSAIRMESGKPTWTKEKCVMCLGCLHRCPKFAIQYGNKTKKHGQYLNPEVKV